jgi:protein-glutamine gamma-glutamyltransferase
MKNLTSDRVLVFLLVTVECAALAFMSRHFGFALCITAIALALLPLRIELNLRRVQIQTLALIVVLIFALKSRWVPTGLFPGNRAFLTYAYGYAVAQFCITLQVMLCLALPGARRWPGLIILLGTLALMYAGNKYTVYEEREIFRIFTLIFVMLSAAYLTACARQPSGAAPKRSAGRVCYLMIALLLAALTTWKAGQLVVIAEPYASRVLGKMAFGGSDPEKWSAGFSSRSVLESIRHWKRNEENAMALRVISRRPPGYLRGKVFRAFDGSAWTTAEKTMEERTESPFLGAANLPSPLPEERFFRIDEVEPQPTPRLGVTSKARVDNYSEIEIYPLQEIQEVLFSSLGARFLGADLNYVTVDGDGAVSSLALPNDGRYRVLIPDRPSTRTLTGYDREAYLQISRVVDPRVVDLSTKVFRGCKTPREKMRAVESFFRRNFLYELNTFYAKDHRDSLLTSFLLERPPAHCEYFASGSVLLLRLAGVPCRYVTGFVCEEKNMFGNYWVARNRDAHAWVEAWDDDEGWVIVESTPPEGIPGRNKRLESGETGQIWDTFKFYLSKTKAVIKAGLLRQRVMELLEYLVWKGFYLRSTQGRLIALGFLTLGVIHLVRIRRRRRPVPEDPLIAALHRCLAVMDRRLARRNLLRKPNETLHQFAERVAAAGKQDSWLEHASAWYRRYAVLRYGGAMDPDSVHSLREAMEWRKAPSLAPEG